MSDPSWLWAVFTLIAAAAQTVRNAAQRELTGTLGTVGATHVRFLFGCPFALLILAGVLLSGAALPRPGLEFWPWVLAGALMQIAATALMLAAMGRRFVVRTHEFETKTEHGVEMSCSCIDTGGGVMITNTCPLHNPVDGLAIEHPAQMTGLLSVLDSEATSSGGG